MPKICLEDVAGAETLPPSGEREPCPPCNPGFYNNDTATCSPCPPGTYSDGTKRTETFAPVVCFTEPFFHVLLSLALCALLIVFFIPPIPSACERCPAGTEATLGYEYKWWNVLPANMKSSCFNVGNSKCDGMNGGRCLSSFCTHTSLLFT